MPHFGLMDERLMGPVEGPLQRSRLHLRGARRRLRQGKISAGIVTLYDAVDAAMQAYAADPARRGRLNIQAGEDMNNEGTLYRILVRGRVLDGTFDFAAFDTLTELALHQQLAEYDYLPVLSGVETVLLQLGVMPFDEATLPPEDPGTY